MAVVTSQGQIGSGGLEVAARVARLLEADYVDRLIFAEAARRIGSTIEAVAQKELRRLGLRDRITRFLQIMLERSAVSGAGGEPYFGPGIEALLAREYTEVSQEPLSSAQEIDDRKFLEVTKAVVEELAQEGNVVIVGRGANIILRNAPGVLHVCFIAPEEQRIRTIMDREHLNWQDAQKYTAEMEKARVAYFKKFFRTHPDDPALYHMTLNLGTMDTKSAAEVVAQAARIKERPESSTDGGA